MASLADELLLINTQLANRGVGTTAQPVLQQTPRGHVINNVQALRDAYKAYHPQNNRSALLNAAHQQHDQQFKLNADLFNPRPGEPTPKAPAPVAPSPLAPFKPAGLPGPFGGAPKTPGAAPSQAAPSQADVQRLTDATKLNQTKAFDEAAQANDVKTNPQASGHDVFPLVAKDEGLTPEEAQNVYRAMLRESNGNNEWQSGGTHDVNSGVDPAYGPLQIIQKTFDAYADPGWNRMNAYHSMRAAIRYARSRYGAGWSQRMAASGY